MTTILDRVRAHGGDVIRKGWNISIRPGRLSPEALEWLRGRRDHLMMEVWPEFDRFQERAAIREFDGGQTREEAEAAAYAEVMNA